MKKQKGITLVALIITIIVMLILAGVAISMVVGDNGVVEKTQTAMQESERANIQDIIIASYVYKITASTNTVAVLDLERTGIAMYQNLTANGFTVKNPDKITIDGIEYTAIKYGDCSGDGNIDSMDMYQIIQYLLGNYTLEENSLIGGFGSFINCYYLSKGESVKVINLGIKDEFVSHGLIENQLKENGLTVENIKSIITAYKEIK